MRILHLALMASLAFAFGGCWVAHTAHDRPLLREDIGKTFYLSNACILFRDRGGRLHLTDDVSGYYAPVISIEEHLPAGTPIKILDVVYRITEAGRYDFFVIEIRGGRDWSVYVNVTHRPDWIETIPVATRSSRISRRSSDK